MMYWLYGRDMSLTQGWVLKKFKAPYGDANVAAMHAGYNYANTIELFQSTYEVPPADLPSGKYRNVMGNTALAIGLVAAANNMGRTLFYGSYPITPASDILHALAPFKNYGVVTFQAEDEIAGICAAIGASYGGNIGVTGTSGPGLALKAEAIGLAVMTELPLIVINVQRGGPSTGLPTKTEQSDLLQAMYGRNGECPIPIIAARAPSDAFDVAYEAVRIATTYMVPVILMTDGYIANGSEPWKVPQLDELPDINVENRTDPEGFQPYTRDPATLARPWAVPGTPGLEHRIGGLEKEDITGNVSYDPANHQHMCETRAAKVNRIQDIIPPIQVHGDQEGTLVLGWGSTYGAIHTAVNQARTAGQKVGHVHLRYINPFPKDLGETLARYDNILCPELNLGQLSMLVRAKYLVDIIPLSKIQGQPFRVSEIAKALRDFVSQ
jgi:2-oxoglutarate ferredoxin oxidoreductase subunit alpha